MGGIPGTFFFGIHPLLSLASLIALYTQLPFKEKIHKNQGLFLYLIIPYIILNILIIAPDFAPKFIGLVKLPLN